MATEEFTFTDEMKAVMDAPLSDVGGFSADVVNEDPTKVAAPVADDPEQQAPPAEPLEPIAPIADEPAREPTAEDTETDPEPLEPATGDEPTTDDWIDAVMPDAEALGLTRDDVENLGSRGAFDTMFRLHARQVAEQVRRDREASKAPEPEKDAEPETDAIDEALASIKLETYEEDARKDFEALMGAVRGLRDENKALRAEMSQPSTSQQQATLQQFLDTASEIDPELFGGKGLNELQRTGEQNANLQRVADMVDAMSMNPRYAQGNLNTLMRLATQAEFSNELASRASDERADKLKRQSAKRQTAGSQARKPVTTGPINSMTPDADDHVPELAEKFREWSE